MTTVSVVIPCYRSESTLPALASQLVPELEQLRRAGTVDEFEIVLIVDGSPDRAAEVARSLSAADDRIRVLELRRNFGQHNALMAGIRAARFETVVTMDDDLQHRPDQIGLMLAALDASTDLVYGIPDVEEHGAVRSAASRFIKWSLRLAGVPNAGMVGAFRAFRTELRDGFAAVDDPHVNLDVVLSWVTADVRAQRVTMDRRQEGGSNYRFRGLVRHAMNMITGYGTVPLRLATYLGLLCGVLGLVLLAIVLVQFFIGVTTVPGFTTTIAVVALFASAQMIAIGIIGEYLGRQHFRSMQRPMYVVRETPRG